MAKSNAKATPPAEVPGKEVVSIQDRIKQRLAKVNESTAAPGSSKISVKGSMFTLPDGKSAKGPLNAIILDYVNSNAWYADDFVEGQFAEPECTATGREIKLLAPSDNVKDAQSDDCVSCPKNQFGSKGRGKACQNGVILAILPDDFTEESEVYTIRVSATALKDWSRYVRELSDKQLDPAQVITSLSFKDGLSYPSLKFRALDMHDRIEEVGGFLASADVMLTANA